MNEGRGSAYLLFVFVLLTIALQVMGLGPVKSTMWGVHLPAFLPLWVAILGWIVVLGSASALLLGLAAEAPREFLPSFTRFTLPRWSRWIVGLALAAGLLWVFRSRQDMLGDALPLTNDLPKGVDTHPRQPLTQWIQHMLYVWLSPVLGSEELAPREIAARTVAAGSVACGLLFLPVARGLSQLLTEGSEDPVTRRLVFGLMCTQGWALLFFGYLENYTFLLLTLSFFVWAALEALRNRWPLWPAAIAMALGIALHLSAMLLVPALLLVAVQTALRTKRRWPVARDLLIGVAALSLLGWLLQRHDPNFELLSAARRIFAVASQDQGGGSGVQYLFSSVHLKDWLNEQLLLGPLGGMVWLFCAGATLTRWRTLSAAGGFLLALSALVFVAHFTTAEPALGYARDWDLFAPTGALVTIAALALLLRLVPPAMHRRALLALLVLSLWHSGVWIAINASEARSLERFAHLPLGRGRTEVAVGNWHLRHGDTTEAKRWLNRALSSNPTNNNAYFILARIEEHEGQTDRAVQLLERAIRLRPRKPEYHRQLVDVLEDAGRTGAALAALERWIEVDSGDADRWYRLARMRFTAGQTEAATTAMRRAVTLYEQEWARGQQSTARAVRLGDLLAGLSDLERAQQWYEEGLQSEGAELAHARLAVLATSMGDSASARTHLEQAWAGNLDESERARLRAVAERLGVGLGPR